MIGLAEALADALADALPLAAPVTVVFLVLVAEDKTLTAPELVAVAAVRVACSAMHISG